MWSGTGSIEVGKCDSAANDKTSWANQPACYELGSWSMTPGNSYTLMSSSCAASQRVAYRMCGSNGMSLRYFQDYNPAPIGLYIRKC